MNGEVYVKKTAAASASAKTKLGQPVLVTTKHRGVFFGYLKGAPGEHITLLEAQECTYWSAAMKGFLGLADIGPDKDCRIGRPVHEFFVSDVTSITKVTDAAVVAWKNMPWK